jgi:type VI secretion system secreted protein VgrG
MTMDYFTMKKFSFISKALPEDTFGVISMKGIEGISNPYEFEIMLVSDNLEIDFDALMQGVAKLVFHRETGDDAIYNGIITRFEYLHDIGEYAFYRASLVPRLWWLSITRHNQIFLDKSVPEFAKLVLIDGGLTANDFEFRLQSDYEPIEYVCQYNESHLNFLSRWLEREGIYYYFDQTPDGEKVIFTDTRVAHTGLATGQVLSYLPPSGLDSLHLTEVVRSFHCRRSLMPAKVFLKDYNYERPSLEISGEAEVDPRGRGTVFFYHEHIRTPEEGKRLAGIRAEGIRCQREIYQGEGSVPSMLPGFTFRIDNHSRPGVNQEYLIIDIEHEGNQTGYLLAGISPGPDGGAEKKIYYRNHFSAIPVSVQFRPETKAEKPKISGTISGRVDAAGSGQYAELDPQGRYKIVFPFDLSGRKDGKASKWVRMAQPYAGSDHGMHFPLHKDTEVLITFLNGDPDRPVIAGAVPNPGTPSPVTGNNQTMSVLNTAGRNRIAIEDKAGSERMLFHSPNQGSYIRIGAPNDPDPYGEPTTDPAPGAVTATSAAETGGQTTDTTQEQIASLQEQIAALKEAGDSDQEQIDTLQEQVKKLQDDKDIAGIKVSSPSGAFTFEAGAKNEVCFGESVEVTIGAAVEAFLIAMADICLGERFILDAGLKQEISMALKSELHKDHLLVVIGKKLKLLKDKDEFAAKVNELREEELKAVGNKTVVTEQNTAAHVDHMVAAENTTRATGQKSDVAGMVDQAVGEKTQALGNRVDTVADRVEVIAQVTQAVGDEAFTAASSVRTLASILLNAAEHNAIHLNSNELTTLKSIM